MKLYRVRIETASSVQPSRGATTWQTQILYCGYDLSEARRAYHESEPLDFSRGPGNPARHTLFEALDFSHGPGEDEPGEMEIATAIT